MIGHARQGARLLRRLRLRERRDRAATDQHRALADLLDRARPARRRRRAGRARAARARAPARAAPARERPRAARARSPARASRCRTGEMHIVPLIVGDERAAMALCQAALERGVFAQAIRPPTVPAGHLAAAPGGDGLAQRRRAARRRPRARRDAPASSGSSPAAMGPLHEERVARRAARRTTRAGAAGAVRLRRRCATAAAAGPAAGDRAEAGPFDFEREPAARAPAPPSPRGASRVRGLFVTGTDTGVGKTVVSACLLAAMRAAGEPVRAYKPVLTGLEEPPGDAAPWPRRPRAARRAGRDAPRGGLAAALRPGRLPAPGGRSSPGEDRPAAR